MNCREVNKLMDAWFDRELQPASVAELEAHLSTCAHCQENWGGLVALLTDPEPIEVPLGLRDRIVNRVMEENSVSVSPSPARPPQSHGQLPSWIRWYKYVGAAAACVAFFAAGWLVSNRWQVKPETGGQPQQVATVVMSPWMMSSLAQAAAMPGVMSPAAMLAQAVMPELLIEPASMTEPAVRVRPRVSEFSASQPADEIPPEMHVLPIVTRAIGV